MDLPVALPVGLFAWLKDHGAGYVVAALWIWTLLRERTTLRARSERLSDDLCRVLESASAERARLSDEYRSGHDWIVHTLLAQFSEQAAKLESWASGTLPQSPPAIPQPSATNDRESGPPPLPKPRPFVPAPPSPRPAPRRTT